MERLQNFERIEGGPLKSTEKRSQDEIEDKPKKTLIFLLYKASKIGFAFIQKYKMFCYDII